jgi:hypothetical protein
MKKARKGICSICTKPIGVSLSSNKCSACYWIKKEEKGVYRKGYWEGVRNGTIRRGVPFKTIVTSEVGNHYLTFDVIYEDQPGYAEAKFIIP